MAGDGGLQVAGCRTQAAGWGVAGSRLGLPRQIQPDGRPTVSVWKTRDASHAPGVYNDDSGYLYTQGPPKAKG